MKERSLTPKGNENRPAESDSSLRCGRALQRFDMTPAVANHCA